MARSLATWRRGSRKEGEVLEAVLKLVHSGFQRKAMKYLLKNKLLPWS